MMARMTEVTMRSVTKPIMMFVLCRHTARPAALEAATNLLSGAGKLGSTRGLESENGNYTSSFTKSKDHKPLRRELD